MAEAVRTESVSFPFDDRTLTGYLALPDGEGPFPALVVIHEAWGLNDNIEITARRFAAAGYIALAADLFADANRAVCLAQFFSGIVFNSLDHPGIRGLKATLDYLTARPDVDGERVGAVGYCMGGSFVVAWACTDDRLRAIAPYYAQNPRPLRAAERSCPVVGSYPGRDFTAPDAHKLDAELDRHGIDHEIKIYPGTYHSFANTTSSRYNRDAAEDSWGRVLGFFESRIGAAKVAPKK